MKYKNYTIERAAQITTPKGKKRGVLDVKDIEGRLVNVFTYTVRNYLSLQTTRQKAKDWIDEQTAK